MTDKKSIAPRSSSLPAPTRSASALPNLPSGPHWFGTATGVARRNSVYIDAHTGYLDARRRQTDAMGSLVDSRINLAAKLADLHNVLFELQQERDHKRAMAGHAREAERHQAVCKRELTQARHEAEWARVREHGVRAQRNLEAAQRVAPAEVDAWYAAAQARRNNALAEFQDTATDLALAPKDGDGAHGTAAQDAQKAHDLALIDHQIELERARGNDAVLALLNLKAMLSGGKV